MANDEYSQQYVQKSVIKSGIPVELKILNKFLTKKWPVRHGGTYEDLDSNLSREIDILAHKSFSTENVIVTIKLCIEAKYAVAPSVIFVQKKTISEKTSIRNKMTIGRRHCYRDPRNNRRLIPLFKPRIGYEGDFREEQSQVGYAFHDVERKGNNKARSLMYPATMQASKAAFYFMRKEMEHPEVNQQEFNTSFPIEVVIFQPVVIIKGDLYKAQYDLQNDNIALSSSDYVQAVIPYSSPKYRKINQPDLFFCPDIMTLDYLDKYINETNRWLEFVCKEIQEVYEKHQKKVI